MNNMKRKANHISDEKSPDFVKDGTSNSFGKNFSEEKRIKVESEDGLKSPCDSIEEV